MKFRQEEILHQAFYAGLAAADPQSALPKYLEKIYPEGLTGKCKVVGAGKASASMAFALEKFALSHWPLVNLSGLVITRYGHDVQNGTISRKINIVEAAHPVPDESGLRATKLMHEEVKELSPGDQLIVLISGGGSSLLTLPVDGIDLEQIQQLTQLLLRCGAPIEEMNIVRKHLSAIQGGNLGRLAARQGATVNAFIISDVTGDDPTDIASGPCAVDPSTFQDALEVLKRYQLTEDPNISQVLKYFNKGISGQAPETLKITDKESKDIHNHVFATPIRSLEAASKYCLELGFNVEILSDKIKGEAKEAGIAHAKIALERSTTNLDKPLAIISGGETTVTMSKDCSGRGGRCAEFLLSLYQETQGLSNLSALAADTDGIDGSENNAGAFFTQDTRKKANELNLEANLFLREHDAYSFFLQTGSLVNTGPTLTNVNDFRIMLINPL